MSDFPALALIFSSFFAGAYLFFHLTKLANEVGAEVATGMACGVPVSTERRRMLLYGTWPFYVLGAVACILFFALANLRIAGLVADPGIRQLAYLAALIGAIAASTWLLVGPLEVSYYRSLLRQAEAD